MEEWMKCRVYVHCPGLSRGVLHAHFDKLAPGLVADVHIPIDDRGGGPKHYGFVAFKDKSGLDEALKAGPYQYIGGKKCKVEEARERPQSDRPPPTASRRLTGYPELLNPGQRPVGVPLRPPQVFPGGANKGLGPRLHVAQVPSTLSAKDIKNHFKRWGEVTDVYFPKDDDREGKRASYCFVTFKTETAAQEAMNESDRRINGRIVGAITRAAERPEHYNEGPELMPGEAGMLGLYQQGVTGMLSGNFGYLGQGRDAAMWSGAQGGSYEAAGGNGYDNFDFGFQGLQLNPGYNQRMMQPDANQGNPNLMQRRNPLDSSFIQMGAQDVRQQGYPLGAGTMQADWLAAANYPQWPQQGSYGYRPASAMIRPRGPGSNQAAAFASLMDPQGGNPGLQQADMSGLVSQLAGQGGGRMDDMTMAATLQQFGNLNVTGRQNPGLLPRGNAGARFMDTQAQVFGQGGPSWVLDPSQQGGPPGGFQAGRAGYGYQAMYDAGEASRGLAQGMMRPQGPSPDGPPQN